VFLWDAYPQETMRDPLELLNVRQMPFNEHILNHVLVGIYHYQHSSTNSGCHSDGSTEEHLTIRVVVQHTKVGQRLQLANVALQRTPNVKRAI